MKFALQAIKRTLRHSTVARVPTTTGRATTAERLGTSTSAAPLRIAFVSNEFPPNVRAGLGRYAERIVSYFNDDGHQLSVFAANSGSLPAYEVTASCTVYRPVHWWMRALLGSEWLCRWRSAEIALIALNVLLYSIDSFFLIRKLHRQQPFDVVAIHDTTSSPVGGILLALTTTLPIVFHVHSTETTMTPWAIVKDPLRIIALLERTLARLANRIIVPSADQVAFLGAHGWDTRKIVAVAHGYDATALQHLQSLPAEQHTAALSALRARLELVDNQPVIVFVGRLVMVKGVYTLLRAMAQVAKTVPQAKLVLVGEGKGRGKDGAVERLIRELQLEQHVFAYHRFLSAAQVALHAQLANVCVFPSLYEPFGLVAVEAMTLGKAVILGPGFARVFAGPDPAQPTAHFVERDDPALLANAIVALLQDPSAQQRLGAAAKAFVTDAFRWERTVASTIEVYREAIRDYGAQHAYQ